MATKLPKMGGQKKKKRELWQTSCQKLREKFNSNFCIEVAKNEGKKEEDLDRKLEEKKKICGNWFMVMELPKWEEKKFVAMLLPKCKEKKLS